MKDLERLVRENIEFKRGEGPAKSLDIGQESSANKLARAKRLKERILGINSLALDSVIELIDLYERCVDNLVHFGVEPKDIAIPSATYPPRIRVNSWGIVFENEIKNFALLEKHAKKMQETLAKYDINVEEGSSFVQKSHHAWFNISEDGKYNELRNYIIKAGGKWKD